MTPHQKLFIFKNEMTKQEIEKSINDIITSTASGIKREESQKYRSENYYVLKDRLEKAEELKSQLYKYDYCPEGYQKFFEVRLSEFESLVY